MIVFPISKINLGLRITGKRPDGYHDIETLFYPLYLNDALEFIISKTPVKKDILAVTGINNIGDPENNLVIKAAKKLREIYPFPFLKIHLHKVIPSGAGLGGGSSDAAYLLKAVNRYFKLLIDVNDLKSIALELGSDCPFFIEPVPSFASGRGEILNQVPHVLEGYYIILLNPRVAVNTREAYQNCKPEQPSTSLLKMIEEPVSKWKGLIFNDFENYAFNKHPEIRILKEELYRSGALYSSMSGSGSTVYGIFSDKPKISYKLKDLMIYEGTI